jgi:hypothetical protein
MKNLGRTIDQILKIEPSLEAHLSPIKTKWERYPKKVTAYWEQVLKILNAEITPQHPKRVEIQSVLTVKKPVQKNKYTFEPPSKAETVVGIIPEHLEGRLKRYDRQQIDIAKMGVEARLTHNTEMLISLTRRAELLEINQKKIWAEIKDHFRLWSTDGPVTFLVRKKDNILILTAVQPPQVPSIPSQGPSEGESFLMRLDPEMLRRFFKFFNINPPPGMFPD